MDARGQATQQLTMSDSGDEQATNEDDEQHVCRCINYDTSFLDPPKEEERLVQGDSGPFAMDFRPPFNISDVNDTQTLKTDHNTSSRNLHQELTNDKMFYESSDVNSAKGQKLGHDVKASITTSDCDSKKEERNGIASSRIQQPQTPDQLESSAFYIQNRVISTATCTQGYSVFSSVDIEREYMLVPFSPNYSFSVLKEENDRLRAEVRSLRQRGCSELVSEETTLSVEEHDEGSSNQKFLPLDPLVLRIFEKSFSRQDIETAYEFTDYPLTSTTLLRVLLGMDTSESEDTSTEDECDEDE